MVLARWCVCLVFGRCSAWSSAQSVTFFSHQTRESFPSCSPSPLNAIWQSLSRLSYAFLLRRGLRLPALAQRPDWWSAPEMVILPSDSPISAEEFWSCVKRVYWVLGHIADQGPSCPLSQFGWSPGSSKRLPFHNYWGQCAPGNTQCFWDGIIPFPWSMPCHNFIAEVYISLNITACFFSWHVVWIVAPEPMYEGRCVPF